MADLVPTQAVVESGSIREITLGEAVTAVGQVLNNSFTLAKASGTVSESIAAWIALETGSIGAAIRAVRAGSRVDMGAIFTAGVAYYLSANAGNMAPYADLGSTNKVSFMGIAETTNILIFQPLNSAVALP